MICPGFLQFVSLSSASVFLFFLLLNLLRLIPTHSARETEPVIFHVDQLMVQADRTLSAIPLAPELVPLVRSRPCPDTHVSISESGVKALNHYGAMVTEEHSCVSHVFLFP